MLTHILTAVLLLAASALSHAQSPTRAQLHLGTLQSTPEHAQRMMQAGVELATLELGWNRFEPSPGAVDAEYIREVKARMETFQSAGIKVVLDLGVQYPPAWLLEQPGARYVNQYGDSFVDSSLGKNIANSVFNARVRELQA